MAFGNRKYHRHRSGRTRSPGAVLIPISLFLFIVAWRIPTDSGTEEDAQRPRLSACCHRTPRRHRGDPVVRGLQHRRHTQRGRSAGIVFAPVSLRMAVVLGLLLAYIVILIPVGFFLATIAFLFATATFSNLRRRCGMESSPWRSHSSVYQTFTQLMQVQLPAGIPWLRGSSWELSRNSSMDSKVLSRPRICSMHFSAYWWTARRDTTRPGSLHERWHLHPTGLRAESRRRPDPADLDLLRRDVRRIHHVNSDQNTG